MMMIGIGIPMSQANTPFMAVSFCAFLHDGGLMEGQRRARVFGSHPFRQQDYLRHFQVGKYQQSSYQVLRYRSMVVPP